MFLIRVDANSKIGMGHLTRCLSIACALRELNEKVFFVMADASAKQIVEKQGFDCEVLDTDYTDLEQELPLVEHVIKSLGNVLVLVDSYYVTKRYFDELRKCCKVAYVDDFGRLEYNLDCVVNGNIYGVDIPYKEHAVNPKMRCATGCEYTPLRDMFRTAQRRPNAERILVTTGGSDPLHITVKIVQEIIRRERLCKKEFDVVCGRFNSDVELIRQLCAGYSNIKIHHDVKDMSELMTHTGYAITAGGSTMYELAKMGIPMCSFSFVDNQERIVQSFFEKGYSCYGGDYLGQGGDLISELCDKLEWLLDNNEEWNGLSKQLMQLVDGHGSQRIAEQLVKVLRIS